MRSNRQGYLHKLNASANCSRSSQPSRFFGEDECPPDQGTEARPRSFPPYTHSLKNQPIYAGHNRLQFMEPTAARGEGPQKQGPETTTDLPQGKSPTKNNGGDATEQPSSTPEPPSHLHITALASKLRAVGAQEASRMLILTSATPTPLRSDTRRLHQLLEGPNSELVLSKPSVSPFRALNACSSGFRKSDRPRA